MPTKLFMPIQFISTLEIMHVCWVSEFNTGITAKWQLQGICFQYSTVSLRLQSTVPFHSFFREVLGFFLMDYCREKGREKYSHFHRIALCHLGMQSRDAGLGGSRQKRVQLHEELLSYTDQKPGFEDQSPLPLLPGLFPGMPPPLLVSEHPMGEQDICKQAFT